MNGAVVELDTLTDSDRTRAENYNLLLVGWVLLNKFRSLVFIVKGAVEVGSFCGELSSAGINHLVNSGLFLYAAFLDRLTRKLFNGLVKIAELLRHIVLFLCKLSVCKPSFQLNKVLELTDKPLVNLCDFVDFIYGNTTLKRFKNAEAAVNVNVVQLLFNFLVGKLCEGGLCKSVHTKLD